ncbi:secretory lipase-domain-containing protein [Talaromyces proteolyticus]|uniref:Secretory lipase-domain-containing protein n=1 Tax=Talaromyces proteolyticus TaxID=1131652 RepID=A0AAD4Q3Y7_9EURO|nr:secretory lipase-domain-containing protein [Talaromyces proteolyticus]KAH8702201.1 secretory lipase-domain-containing protein [Talaromyces proteolyticus]
MTSAKSASVSVPRRSNNPDTDPFYQPPAGFASQKPGSILRERSITASFFGLIPEPIETHQLLYRTTAVNGSAIASVTTIFKPWFPKTDRFISFQTAYDSSSTSCVPSYQYQLGNPQTDLIAQLEFLIIQIYLLMGYIVVSPDYEGPEAAFAPGRLAGMGVLDSMRAVANFKSTLGLNTTSPMIVGTGYSGGSIATGWAASLHPTYAPELNIKGWTQGGTPANLLGTLLNIDGTVFSGFGPDAIAGLSKSSTYGAQLGPIIDEYFTSEGKSAISYTESNCAISDLVNFFEKSVLSTDIQSLGDGLLQDPTIASILAENVMGVVKDETPTAPVFVYHASQDEIIPYSNASTLVDSWCSNGASVNFTTFASGGHITTEILGIVDVVEFVEAAFAGKTTSGCAHNTELSSALNPIALGAEIEPILIDLVTILTTLGKSDSNISKNISILKNVV